MRRFDYPGPIRTLIEQLRRFPGIGPRSAERIALWVARTGEEPSRDIAAALRDVPRSVRPCPTCGFFAEAALCAICSSNERAGAPVLCVVEEAVDVLPLERAGAFDGLYHVLAGRLSPLDGIGPDQIRVAPLLERARSGQFQEVILALSADVEGEATAHYLADLLRPLPLTLSRLARGLPAGAGLESADQLTLARALAERVRL